MRSQKTNYIDAEELRNEYKKSQEAGRCTERLGQMFMTVADHVTGCANFRRYPNAVKEDMKSLALLKLVKSVDTADLERFNAKQIFNYVSRTVWTAFLTELSKHYRQINIKRELTKMMLEQADFMDPRTKSLLLQDIEQFESKMKNVSNT